MQSTGSSSKIGKLIFAGPDVTWANAGHIREAILRSYRRNAMSIDKSFLLSLSRKSQRTLSPSALTENMAKKDSPAFIHPLGICDSSTVGSGTRVWAFAHILKGARIGQHCNICDQVFVESGATVGNRVTIKNGVMLWDGVTVEDDVFLGPGVIFTNDMRPRIGYRTAAEDYMRTYVRQGATIGAGAVVLCGIEIGSKAFVGAGAVVLESVPAHGLVVGNPARHIGWVCDCGRQLQHLHCVPCNRTFTYSASGCDLTAAEPSIS